MFDVGMTEMMVIAVVALIVLGPEKLPKVARTIGHLLGRAQRYVNQVKQDINREMELSELKKIQEEARAAASTFQNTINQTAQSIESEARSLESTASVSPPAPPPSTPTDWGFEASPPPAPAAPPEKIDPR